MSQKYNSEYINELEAFFIGRNDNVNRLGNAISHYLTLPGLIGFWPMATVQRSTGNVPNYAPTYAGATKQDLVYNGNPVFNYTSTGVPYIDLDGSGDYLNVADNTDIDILGSEAIYANPGLTMGCWARPSALTTIMDFMGKGTNTAVANDSYFFEWRGDLANDPVYFYISDGAAYDGVGLNTSASAGVWYYIVARYIPSTSIKVYFNTTAAENLVGIPAALNNSATSFFIGSLGAPNNRDFAGDMTLVFLCATAIHDSIIQSLFQQTRSLFGV